MPEISRFYGIVIAMFYRDHEPPHFHVTYADHRATIGISDGAVHGYLPPRVLSLVREWRELHHTELTEDWLRARSGAPLVGIAPLE